ncbi:restriction endonuclease [Xanthomonas nasturtii]|uniref:restriction endonuclease subunit S n=1 Tax=Xanthomonas nasturtii TaxID=1843581 RepID=UPI0007E3326A|nr:restriction endonuclease subunit S [Xanthomonas nasturtii]OAX87921.1 restriction endonuclease [Xanthomonas nasturtii]WVL57749.1 restriction endonuclease subunit S [Xanthomonas nasturtii]
MRNKTLKSGWRWVQFGDVVRQCKKKADPETSGLERYIAGDHMDTDDLRLRRWGEIGSGYLGPAFHMRFKPGQVLYGSRRTYLRKVAVADFEGVCANTTFVLEPKNPEELLPEFLPFLMQTEAFNAFSINNSKGSVNPYINFSDLERFPFALPPIEDQRSAVDLLRSAKDHCYAVDEVHFSTGRILQALKDSLLRLDSSDVAKSYVLGDLLLGSPESGCSAPPRDANTGYFVLGLAALSREGYVSGDFKPVEPTSKMLAAKLSTGDMLISRSNTADRVGFVGVFNDNRADVSFPDTMMRLRPNPVLIRPTFLEALLQTTSAREYLMRIAAGTSASMKKINRANLLQMRLNVPSLNVQDSALSQLREVEKAMAAQKSRRDAARQWAKLMTARAIGGEA